MHVPERELVLEVGNDGGAGADLRAERALERIDRVCGRLYWGSTLSVAARTSLLWNPMPPFTKNSVLAHGPKIALSFGLSMLAPRFAEFWGTFASTIQ